MNAFLQSVTYFFMRKDDFASRLLDVAAPQAINRFSIVVWNLLYIGVAAFTTDTSMGPPVKKRLIHVKQSVVTVLVHAGKTSETMAHKTVFRIYGV
jgi:hypothetical protein